MIDQHSWDAPMPKLPLPGAFSNPCSNRVLACLDKVGASEVLMAGRTKEGPAAAVGPPAPAAPRHVRNRSWPNASAVPSAFGALGPTAPSRRKIRRQISASRFGARSGPDPPPPPTATLTPFPFAMGLKNSRRGSTNSGRYPSPSGGSRPSSRATGSAYFSHHRASPNGTQDSLNAWSSPQKDYLSLLIPDQGTPKSHSKERAPWGTPEKGPGPPPFLNPTSSPKGPAVYGNKLTPKNSAQSLMGVASPIRSPQRQSFEEQWSIRAANNSPGGIFRDLANDRLRKTAERPESFHRSGGRKQASHSRNTSRSSWSSVLRYDLPSGGRPLSKVPSVSSWGPSRRSSLASTAAKRRSRSSSRKRTERPRNRSRQRLRPASTALTARKVAATEDENPSYHRSPSPALLAQSCQSVSSSNGPAPPPPPPPPFAPTGWQYPAPVSSPLGQVSPRPSSTDGAAGYHDHVVQSASDRLEESSWNEVREGEGELILSPPQPLEEEILDKEIEQLESLLGELVSGIKTAKRALKAARFRADAKAQVVHSFSMELEGLQQYLESELVNASEKWGTSDYISEGNRQTSGIDEEESQSLEMIIKLLQELKTPALNKHTPLEKAGLIKSDQNTTASPQGTLGHQEGDNSDLSSFNEVETVIPASPITADKVKAKLLEPSFSWISRKESIASSNTTQSRTKDESPIRRMVTLESIRRRSSPGPTPHNSPNRLEKSPIVVSKSFADLTIVCHSHEEMTVTSSLRQRNKSEPTLKKDIVISEAKALVKEWLQHREWMREKGLAPREKIPSMCSPKTKSSSESLKRGQSPQRPRLVLKSLGEHDGAPTSSSASDLRHQRKQTLDKLLDLSQVLSGPQTSLDDDKKRWGRQRGRRQSIQIGALSRATEEPSKVTEGENTPKEPPRGRSRSIQLGVLSRARGRDLSSSPGPQLVRRKTIHALHGVVDTDASCAVQPAAAFQVDAQKGQRDQELQPQQPLDANSEQPHDRVEEENRAEESVVQPEPFPTAAQHLGSLFYSQQACQNSEQEVGLPLSSASSDDNSSRLDHSKVQCSPSLSDPCNGSDGPSSKSHVVPASISRAITEDARHDRDSNYLNIESAEDILGIKDEETVPSARMTLEDFLQTSDQQFAKPLNAEPYTVNTSPLVPTSNPENAEGSEKDFHFYDFGSSPRSSADENEKLMKETIDYKPSPDVHKQNVEEMNENESFAISASKTDSEKSALACGVEESVLPTNSTLQRSDSFTSENCLSGKEDTALEECRAENKPANFSDCDQESSEPKLSVETIDPTICNEGESVPQMDATSKQSIGRRQSSVVIGSPLSKPMRLSVDDNHAVTERTRTSSLPPKQRSSPRSPSRRTTIYQNSCKRTAQRRMSEVSYGQRTRVTANEQENPTTVPTFRVDLSGGIAASRRKSFGPSSRIKSPLLK